VVKSVDTTDLKSVDASHASSILASRTIVETTMKQKKKRKQRNRLVALSLFRKAGKHRKTNKALRKKENQERII
jgi:hypothetical protein